MAKKMYDIMPPNAAGKKSQTVAERITPVKKSVSRAAKPTPHKEARMSPPAPEKKPAMNRQRFPLKELLVGGAVIVVLLCVYGYLKLPKADVEIWPNIHPLTLHEKVTADTSATAVSFAGKVIPARLIEIQKDGSQSFPATGISSADGYATGTITVYNKISPSKPFTLVKGTHFLSDSGKYFITNQKITVPAAKNNVPGSMSVSVRAQEVGADYNIGASKFSLPKLSGTTYYYSIYGASTSAMAGGYTGKVKKVTQDDIQSAKDVLTKQLLSQAEVSLKSQIAGDDVLLSSAMASNTVSSRVDALPGAVADNFNEQASVKASALVFKKQDIESFVKSDINAGLAAGNSFLENSIVVNYRFESADLGGGKLRLNLDTTVNTYPQINTADVIDLFTKKSADQIKAVVDQMYGGKISELKVNFWPFWVTKAPSDKSRIKVNLNF